MAKPVGPSCNLQCTYCFYLEKQTLYPNRVEKVMPEATLEAYIRQYTEAQQHLPEIHFAWQGGEPTLAGLEFFRKAISLQHHYACGKPVNNSLQTNGILLDDAWAEFFAEHRFLIGLSLDGPERFHDAYRRDRGGYPTFKKVMKSVALLKHYQVDFNILACVNRITAAHPDEIYPFLRAHGSGFIQFIPIVERRSRTTPPDGLTLVAPEDTREADVTEWSVSPRDYGNFLCEVFDLWVTRDVGKVFVQLFDVSLEAWMGFEPSLCFFRSCCGDALILEYNGDLYSCDHFVYPAYRLGNIHETPLRALARSQAQRRFGESKRDNLPTQCQQCPVLFACRGECPKHRFLVTSQGERGINYFCEAYKRFFNHIDPYMKFMANELRHQRPPANVMNWAKAHSLGVANTPNMLPKVMPNDLCPCGSGRKYKKCCGMETH